MKNCNECGETVDDEFDMCWKCGALLPEPPGLHNFKIKRRIGATVAGTSIAAALGGEPKKVGSFLWVWVVLFLATSTTLLGHFHVVTGISDGLRLLPRDEFGYSEIYVDGAAIKRMPPLVAIVLHPLGVRAMAREGYLDRD